MHINLSIIIILGSLIIFFLWLLFLLNCLLYVPIKKTGVQVNNFISFFRISVLGAVIFAFALNAHASGDLLEKAIAEYKAENYEEALHLLLEVRREQPDSPTALFYLGLAHKQTGDIAESAKDFKEAIRLDPMLPDAYAELIDALYNLNDFKQAESWINTAESKKISSPRILFLKGLVYSKLGKNDEALSAFRAAKESDSSLRQPADFQIAIIFARERRMSEARETLKAVITTEPSSEIASFAREYLTAIKDIESYRAWRFFASVAYQYDDNVVLKPSAAIPGVLITGEKDSGIVGVFRIDYNPLQTGKWFMNGQFNFYTDTYFHTHSHDLVAPVLTLNPGINFKSGTLSAPILYSRIWLDGSDYEGVFSVKPTYTTILRPSHIGQFWAGYGRRELIQAPLDPEENMDGNVYSFGAGYIHTFSADRGFFNFRYEFTRDITEGSNWTNTGNKVNASVLFPVSKKVSLATGGEAFIQDYSNVHTVFGVKRKDRTYTGNANMIWELSRPLDVNIQYAHTRADSNISLYEYSRNVYTIALEYRF